MAEAAGTDFKGQIPVRVPGQTTCKHHRGKQLDWVCDTCAELICVKCVSSVHQGHVINELSELTAGNKSKISEFIDEIEQHKFSEIQQELSTINDLILKVQDEFRTSATSVTDRGLKLKEDVDLLVAGKRSQLKHLEEQSIKVIYSYKTELERKAKTLREHLDDCKSTLQTGTDFQVFDVTSGLDNHRRLPGQPTLGNAYLIPNSNHLIALDKALGSLILNPNGPTGSPIMDSSSFQTGSAVEYKLLPKTTFLSEWDSPCDISCLAPAYSGGMWVSDWGTWGEYYDPRITHLTGQGKVENSVRSAKRLSDIAVSPVTHNLWGALMQKKHISEVTTDSLMNCTLNKRWTTKNDIKSICFTNDNHILVGTKNKIQQFTDEGKTGFYTTSVCSPRRIACCPITGNIAVTDTDKKGDKSKYRSFIRVLNRDLNELFQYHGDPHFSSTKADNGKGLFGPCDVTYDSMGNIITGDLDSGAILLVSGSGQFLKVLYQHRFHVQAVGVDREGALWGVFGGGFFRHGRKVVRLQHIQAVGCASDTSDADWPQFQASLL